MLDLAPSLQDRQDIADLVAQYNYAIDHHEPEAWAATFTAEGTLMVDGEPRARGRAALIEYVARRRATGTPKLRHWVNNTLVTGDGSTASLRAYVMAFKIDEGLGPPYVLGEYDDDLVRIDGAWRFSVRRLTIMAGGTATSAVSGRQ